MQLKHNAEQIKAQLQCRSLIEANMTTDLHNEGYKSQVHGEEIDFCVIKSNLGQIHTRIHIHYELDTTTDTLPYFRCI